MGKRSNFDRNPRDFYPTPKAAVLPLLPHITVGSKYFEPCAGDGSLINHLPQGMCVGHCDIEPQATWINKRDAMTLDNWRDMSGVDLIITNPPWDRKILHPMIEHFAEMRPTWLLFDADWSHTKQSARFMPMLKKIVSVGRVKWIPDSKMTGKDNAAWYLFDANHCGKIEFVGRV